ncbi:DUF4912 domain-containing protein [Caviibacter abscessus]|uniref:DUF4912 domain-containing protein n=1 Tax=Caviibacter abscessus TaxID=1766719 RepID=UPI00082A2346|nr:DUF4912 domain-containing protein [Caviibacter abscessus]
MLEQTYNFLRKYRNYVNKKLIPSRKRMKRPGYLERVNMTKKAANEITEFIAEKYSVGTDKYFDKAPLPNVYYTDEIVLIPKNTTTIFTYWEVREDTFKALKEKYNVEDQVTLKVYKEKRLFMTIKIPSRVGSKYINNVKADGIYEVSLGFTNNKGEFFEVAHSNTAISPRGRITNNTSVTWGRGLKYKKKIYLKTYSKYDLPDELEFRDEILDDEIKSISSDKKIMYNGSSNLRFGSSDLIRK